MAHGDPAITIQQFLAGRRVDIMVDPWDNKLEQLQAIFKPLHISYNIIEHDVSARIKRGGHFSDRVVESGRRGEVNTIELDNYNSHENVSH